MNTNQQFFYDAVKTENILTVDQSGRVFNTNTNRFIGCKRHKYKSVSFWDKTIKRNRTIPVHELMWIVFKGPVPPGQVVILKDGNKENCELSNIALSTRKAENMRYNRKRGEDQHAAKLTRKKVIKARKLYKDTETPVTEIAKMFGVSYNTMRQAIHGTIWKEVPGAVPRKKRPYKRRTVGKRRTRLTAEMVIEDRAEYAANESLSYAHFAKKRNVSVDTIRFAITGQTWIHVPNPVKREKKPKIKTVRVRKPAAMKPLALETKPKEMKPKLPRPEPKPKIAKEVKPKPEPKTISKAPRQPMVTKKRRISPDIRHKAALFLSLYR